MTTASSAPKQRHPANAFRSRFLAEVDRHEDDPDSALEAETDGPWRVAPCRCGSLEGFGVYRCWEDPTRDPPQVWLASRELALVASAVLPAVGKEPWFRLAYESVAAGHSIETRDGKAIGYLPIFNERFCEHLHLVECLLRSPVALASVLTAASPVALRLAGEVLARRVPTSAPITGQIDRAGTSRPHQDESSIAGMTPQEAPSTATEEGSHQTPEAEAEVLAGQQAAVR